MTRWPETCELILHHEYYFTAFIALYKDDDTSCTVVVIKCHQWLSITIHVDRQGPLIYVSISGKPRHSMKATFLPFKVPYKHILLRRRIETGGQILCCVHCSRLQISHFCSKQLSWRETVLIFDL
jgi:hypothetical protein